MSLPRRQTIGLAFVLAVALNPAVLGAQAGKSPRPKRDTRTGEKQKSPLDARTFANLLQLAQHGDRRAQTSVGVAFAKGEIAG